MSLTYPNADAQIAQVLLRLQYRDLARRKTDLPDFADVEFRCYSQNGEDGLLLYLFSILGTTNRRVVEICAGDGIECNAANLIVNHAWKGLLIDGDQDLAARGRSFYTSCRTTWLAPPSFLNAWVTAENVNELVIGAGFSGPIDLLSLDLDGNDYWIWKTLDAVSPRVVVAEFNASWGPESAVTIPYDPDFRLDLSVQPYRCGASLPAFVKLARAKGYRLVGVQSLGFNAFFVRAGLGEDLLPERSPGELYQHTERLREWHPSWMEAMLSGSQAWQDVP
jgi:hypothetical protein